jgi:hypothetical protein
MLLRGTQLTQGAHETGVCVIGDDIHHSRIEKRPVRSDASHKCRRCGR